MPNVNGKKFSYDKKGMAAAAAAKKDALKGVMSKPKKGY
jgi:hypothetical protein|tara:strand:+ start:655 stop:771 length:117 start_codon:yes stop_codon:yes gene_type:complete